MKVDPYAAALEARARHWLKHALRPGLPLEVARAFARTMAANDLEEGALLRRVDLGALLTERELKDLHIIRRERRKTLAAVGRPGVEI